LSSLLLFLRAEAAVRWADGRAGRPGDLVAVDIEGIVHGDRPGLDGNLRWIAEPDFAEDDDGAGLAVQGLSARHADLVGVYVTGGGISGIASALQELGNKARVVLIGHECTSDTRAQLAARAIDVMLDQDVRGIVHWAGLAAVNFLNDVRGVPGIPTPETRIYLRENARA